MDDSNQFNLFRKDRDCLSYVVSLNANAIAKDFCSDGITWESQMPNYIKSCTYRSGSKSKEGS